MDIDFVVGKQEKLCMFAVNHTTVIVATKNDCRTIRFYVCTKLFTINTSTIFTANSRTHIFPVDCIGFWAMKKWLSTRITSFTYCTTENDHRHLQLHLTYIDSSSGFRKFIYFPTQDRKAVR